MATSRLYVGRTYVSARKEQENKRAKLERERELSKRARNEIICRADPVWLPKNDNRQMAIDN